MRLAHILEQVYHQPWLITPSMHAAVRRLVASKLAQSADAPTAGIFEDFSQQRRPMTIDRDGIARIHLLGVLGQGLSEIEKTCGATDTRDIRSEMLDARESARGILLEIDSPGGMVTGTTETAGIVRTLAGEMPVIAFTDSLCASAAYWIASQADEIYATESANVGSIGVYIPWVDDSEQLAGMGVKLEAIVNEGAIFKGLGFDPHLNDVQRAHLQEKVDRMAADFKAAVNQGRQVEGIYLVPPDIMRGQTAYGDEAMTTGLIDGILDLDGALQRIREMMR